VVRRRVMRRVILLLFLPFGVDSVFLTYNPEDSRVQVC
jgi:hypothetical protein